MCGFIPTAVVIEAAKSLGAHKATILAYGHSGEVLGSTAKETKAALMTVALSHDERMVAVGDRGGRIDIWDVDAQQLVASMHTHRGRVYSLDFNPSGTRIASASLDGTVRLYDVERAEEVLVLRDHHDSVLSVRFDDEGLRLLSTASDGTAILRDALTSTERQARD